jgi:hypothetical protein
MVNWFFQVGETARNKWIYSTCLRHAYLSEKAKLAQVGRRKRHGRESGHPSGVTDETRTAGCMHPTFENSIVTKINQTIVILSNFIKFDIIGSNFDWRMFCTVKN